MNKKFGTEIACENKDLEVHLKAEVLRCGFHDSLLYFSEWQIFFPHFFFQSKTIWVFARCQALFQVVNNSDFPLHLGGYSGLDFLVLISAV